MGQGHDDNHISAFDFDIVREAFRKSVSELNLAEEQWVDHAKLLLHDMTGHEADESMISRIIGR